MDPLSLSASLTAVLQLTATIVQYLCDVKGANEDRQKVMNEIIGANGLLSSIRDLACREQWTDAWTLTIRSLSTPGGPLEQFQAVLDRLATKLKPVEGLRKIGKKFLWPFEKEEIHQLLGTVERQKTLFMLALSNDHIALSRAIKEDVADLHRDIKTIQEGVNRLQAGLDYRMSQLQNQERRDILNWLSPLEFSQQLSDFLSRRQPGTGEWLLNSNAFSTWSTRTGCTLYCQGIPGAGKTMLASIVVDHLQKRPHECRTAVAYMFCNYKAHAEQTLLNLTAALLKQLLQEQDDISAEVKKLHHHHRGKGTRLTPAEIAELLKSEISRYFRVYIIVDALDECDNDNGQGIQLLSILHKMCAAQNINLMVTSRYNTSLPQNHQDTIYLDIRASDADVGMYLEGHMCEMPNCVIKSKTLQDNIKQKITTAADGMFLLAQLDLDSLKGYTTVKAIKSALNALPKGHSALYTAYDQVMERIETQREGFKDLAERVLSWLVHAKRRLSTIELQIALAVEPGESEFDTDNIADVNDIVSVCAGLVTLDQESNIVRLAHYTLQEYFEQIGSNHLHNAQGIIGIACMSYLSQKALTEPYDDIHDGRKDHPFLDYSTQYWGDHIRGGTELMVRDLALTLLDNKHFGLNASPALIELRGPPPYAVSAATWSAMHLCAWFGLKILLIALLDSGHHADLRDLRGRTPLSCAAGKGYEAVVKLLADRNDVDADSKDINGQTPLVHAARSGNEAVVKLLADRNDVNADFKDINGQTPLAHAALCYCEAVDQLLAAEVFGWTVFTMARRSCNEAVVKLLADRNDVNADSKDIYGQTPLAHAANSGCKAVVKLLADRNDVDADFKDIYGQTPLAHAASSGNEAVVKLLADRNDVDVDSKDMNGQTPLAAAAFYGHEAVIRLLIDNNANINTIDDAGSTALWNAVSRGRGRVVKLLLERNADIEALPNHGCAALRIPAREGHRFMVDLLLQLNIEIEARDEHERNKDIYLLRRADTMLQ